MQNMMNDLIELFQKDDRIFTDGKLLKNKLTELALKLDNPLIELLLSDKRAKENFFIESTVKKDKVLVFDKDKFISFVNNKEFLPDSFTSFKNKIGLMSNGDHLKEKSDVVLAWPYKDSVLEGGQDKADQKRDEIFYNETLAPDEIDHLFEPKVLTNFKKYDTKGEHDVTEITSDDNLIIKGNNLLALHCLKKKYRGKVKLIYIDPPYNTGNDEFKYNDRFNHSTWLTFMKNRLEVAKELLRDDGVIFISCDHNEQAYLKVLLDDNRLFGRENYISTLVVENNPKGRKNSNYISISNEFCLIYAKNINNPNTFFVENIPKNISDLTKDENGRYIHNSGKRVLVGESSNEYLKKIESDKHYSVYYSKEKNEVITKKENSIATIDTNLIDEGYVRYISLKNDKFIENTYTPKKLLELFNNKALVFTEDKIFEKNFNTAIRIKSVIKNMKYIAVKNDKEVEFEIDVKTTSAGAYLKSLFKTDKPIFENSKNVGLLKLLLSLSQTKDDIILDFHAGSGTTAHAVLEINKEDGGNRKFVIIEQMDYVNSITCPRVQKVMETENIDASFVYLELAKWNEKYMQDIKDADTSRKLLNLYEKMKKEAFFRYDIDLSKFDEKEFAELSLEEQKQVLCECLDKNHLYVNLSEIDDATYKVSADDKKLNKEFYRQSV